MRTVIYARVSTQQQADGMSLDAQVSTCRAYLELQKQKGDWAGGNVRDVDIVQEQLSGSIPFSRREHGKELLEQLKSGDVLVIAKLDRGWRSVSDALTCLDVFKKHGVAVHLVDLNGNVTDGISQLVFTIMSAVAAWERSRIGERTREAKREAARQGYYVGGKVPWHQRQVRVRGKMKVVDDDKRMGILKKLRAWRQAGVPLRTCQQRVEKLGAHISVDAIRRLTAGFASTDAMKRGRRVFKDKTGQQ
jgi:DNA invertase Pin-like site-specific DNA recombinase